MTPLERAERLTDLLKQAGWSGTELTRRLKSVHGVPLDDRRVRRWTAGAYDVPDAVLKWLEAVVKAIDKLEAPLVPVERNRRRAPGEGEE